MLAASFTKNEGMLLSFADILLLSELMILTISLFVGGKRKIVLLLQLLRYCVQVSTAVFLNFPARLCPTLIK